jgi:peptidyl-prolyl cis-trans isomerase C
VVARVNGVPILASSLTCAQDAAPLIPFSVVARSQDGHPPDIRRVALERLIDIELLYQEGMKKRFPGLAADAERRLRAEKERFPSQGEFEYALLCGSLTEESLRRLVMRRLVIERYLEEAVYSAISVDDAQIARAYRENPSAFLRPEAVRIQHILVRVASWSDPAEVLSARGRVARIQAESAAGADFGSLARRYSDEPASGGRAGDWGLISRGSFGAEFDTVVFRLATGEIGPPVSSHLGFHLIKVLERQPAAPRPLDEVRGEIVTLLRRSEAEKRVNQLLEGLRRQAKVEILIR